MFENPKRKLEDAKGRVGVLKSSFDERIANLISFNMGTIELPVALSDNLTAAIHDLKTSLDLALRELIERDGGSIDLSTTLPTAASQREYENKCKAINTPRSDTISFLLSLAFYEGGAGQDIYRLDRLSHPQNKNLRTLVLVREVATGGAGWWPTIEPAQRANLFSALRKALEQTDPSGLANEIGFGNIESFASESVVPTLSQLSEAVARQLSRFESFVAKRRKATSKKVAHPKVVDLPPGQAGNDFIRDIVRSDLESGRHRTIITRFPPEPNGYLHLGHAKSIGLNFGIAEEFRGHCNLRYDDTNPTTESQEYIDAIKRDVRWLGFDWGEHLYHASDYFEQLYEWAEHLIRVGKAYIDDQTQEQMRLTRGTLTEGGTDSPFRNRSAEVNLDLFRRMRAGEFLDGERVLRAKINMGSGNINLRDPVLYRILHAPHPRTGTRWCIYPSYDFAHGQSDAIEGVTHSLCTLEFEDHRPLYDWFIENLPVPSRPRQYEFARLNLSYTVLSKRVLTELVRDGYVAGWDDPRMPTLAGLRRRGVPPAAIRDFVKRIGVAKADSLVDMAMFEFSIREHLNRTAPRRMAVLRPLRVVIEDYPPGASEELEAINHPEDPNAGTRRIRFDRELFVEREDFAENPAADFFRLAPGREVRLRYAYFITCREVVKSDAGEVVALRCTYDPRTRGGNAGDKRSVEATLHWVAAADAVEAEVRLYSPLFLRAEPDPKDFAVDLNPQSLEVIPNARVEPALAGMNAGDPVQFERQGYFCRDSDSTAGRLVFNRTVGLRDTWAKVSGGAS
jgi:glutaminyl-tRNA synthetase